MNAGAPLEEGGGEEKKKKKITPRLKPICS